VDRETQFQELRPVLFGLAYRMLGSRADAEDVVQDAWMRWHASQDEEVRAPKSYLTTVVARLALDQLKSAARKREAYVGPWLPEPLVAPLGTQPVEMAESLSLAFLLLLETLSPAERAAFLLREAFDAPYGEIAAVLDTSEANARQLAARARQRIHERRPRFAPDPQRRIELLQEFLRASTTGNPAQLTSMLAADVALYTDGGGKVSAALNPIYGADRVARFFAGLMQKGALNFDVRFADVNGEPGGVLMQDGILRGVFTIETDEEGKITGIYSVTNPEKLPV
jgi:RNA polymerase sigma-70 factor (ECF subfamily)